MNLTTLWQALQNLAATMADHISRGDAFGITVIILWSVFFAVAYVMYKTGRGNL